jgi:hypothetical protein
MTEIGCQSSNDFNLWCSSGAEETRRSSSKQSFNHTPRNQLPLPLLLKTPGKTMSRQE